MTLPQPEQVVLGLAIFGLISTICLLVLCWIQTTEKYYFQNLYEKCLNNVGYWSMRNKTYRDFLIDRRLWKEFEAYSATPAVELLPPIHDNDNRKEPEAPIWARIKVPEDATVVDKEIPEPVKS